MPASDGHTQPIRAAPRREKLRRSTTVKKNVVGGDMVSSMKRGLRPKRKYRTWVLAALALALLVLLNWTWISRLDRRVREFGGWRALVEAGMRGITGSARGRLIDEV